MGKARAPKQITRRPGASGGPRMHRKQLDMATSANLFHGFFEVVQTQGSQLGRCSRRSQVMMPARATRSNAEARTKGRKAPMRPCATCRSSACLLVCVL
jgi:hypothetical protein